MEKILFIKQFKLTIKGIFISHYKAMKGVI